MRGSISSSDHAISTLVSLIIRGEFRPGTSLTETELATRLNMSRTPVREAIRHLVAMGLLERRSSHNLHVPSFTIEDAIEILYIREELESLAIRLGAHRLSREELLRLHRRLCSAPGRKSLRLNGGVEGRLYEATAVHDLITSGPQSPVLRLILKALEPHAIRERYFSTQIWDLAAERTAISSKAHQEHVAIVEALIAGGHRRAERLLRQHIRRVRDLILKRFDARARSYDPAGRKREFGEEAQGVRNLARLGPRTRKRDGDARRARPS